VFDGYWNRPDDNARVFRMVDGKRYYNTGDVVRRDVNGEFIFLGRRDRMVKRRGYRVELGEIEHALYRHPKLREVGVISLASETGVRIVACYAGEQPAPSVVELKQFASRELPVYMIPDEFRHFEHLPSTSTGKMDYQRLKAWLGTVAGNSRQEEPR
jgi:acyl-CoA synthetase (AMP-forming)/AMP-acid ligase II